MSLTKQVFLAENFVKAATITPSTVNSQYPISNIKDDRRTKVFRSTNNSTNVVFDLLTPRGMNCVAMVDTGFDSFGFDSLTIQMNNSDIWTSPAVSQVVTIASGSSCIFHYFDTVQTYRYVRLVLTGSAGYCELSKVFIGESVDLGNLGFSYPLEYSLVSNSTVTKNRVGQRFIDEINTYRDLSGSILVMDKEEFQPVLDMLKYSHTTKPIWILFPEGTITEDNDQLNGYYYLKSAPVMNLQSGNFWSVELSFEEGL
jgi:hypothetical protein